LVDDFFKHDRVLIEASLELANGSFFQPTGFPDIGACIFVDRDGQRHCLVESEQSTANRLESVCMQEPGIWCAPFDGKLPIIRIQDGSGNLLGTNLTEPHRVSSSYVLEGTFNGGATLQERLRERLGISADGIRWPLDKRSELSRVVFALDPAAVLHGFQFMQWSAVGLRQQRLINARIEAVLEGDSDVHYGAVKVDSIDPNDHPKKSNKGQSIAYKHRLVPKSITATFEIDVLGLRTRRLVKTADGDSSDNTRAQKFLLALALWKIRQFLADQPAFDPRTGQTERSLRLRSDCALKRSKVVYRAQSGGGDFACAKSIEIDQLAKDEKDTVDPLAPIPEFGPLVDAVVGTKQLDLRVTYGKNPKPDEADPAPDVGEDVADDTEE
ncbi:MAG TPA: type I-U CRISPR-associated RAMP protein Csb1/Cas7u, partial [Candidatus Sulfotelmatobacter sp.]|nr:type I-U CRISPR-associated RAMP protein Csb1/Cas7u [Candidatus Sulfotelmatobacter sp.]